MPLVIPCPSCKAKLKAPETLIGKTVKCPNCQSPIAVRAPANTPAPPAKAAAAPAPAKKPAPQNDFDFSDDPDDRPSKKGGAVKKGPEDYDDDDRPSKKGSAAKKGRDDYDDEDDRPSKKGGAIKKGRDDYADEAPRKGKGRDDDYDDDEDDRPKKGKGKKGKGTGPSGPTTDEERSNAFIIYIAAFVGQFIGIGPLGGIIWWVIKRGESRFVDHHGKEFLNLMITNFLIAMLCVAIMVIGGVVGGATGGDTGGILAFVFIGLGF